MTFPRCLPPAATALGLRDVISGVSACLRPAAARDAITRDLAEFLSARHVFLMSSGKASLATVLRALKKGSTRTEVVIPAYTCYSVPSAVVAAGLEPVLCDINPVTFALDGQKLLSAIGDNTLCVIPTHLFGRATDLRPLAALCRAHGAYLLEDAAQAFGESVHGTPVGTCGDVGIFSFGRGKNISCGTGGLVVTNSDAIAERIREEYAAVPDTALGTVIKDAVELIATIILSRPSLFWLPNRLGVGHIGKTIYYKQFPVERLSTFKVGVLAGWRAQLERSRAARTANAATFSRSLSGQARPLAYLRLPAMIADSAARERILERARARGLGIGTMYPGPINDIPEIADRFAGLRFENAALVAQQLVTIPTHHLLSERDRQTIAEFLSSEIQHVAKPAA